MPLVLDVTTARDWLSGIKPRVTKRVNKVLCEVTDEIASRVPEDTVKYPWPETDYQESNPG